MIRRRSIPILKLKGRPRPGVTEGLWSDDQQSREKLAERGADGAHVPPGNAPSNPLSRICGCNVIWGDKPRISSKPLPHGTPQDVDHGGGA